MAQSEINGNNEYSLTPEGFRKYLQDERNLSISECDDYASSIAKAEAYAKEHGSAIYGADIPKALEFAEDLYVNKSFSQQQKAIAGFMAYIKYTNGLKRANDPKVEILKNSGKICDKDGAKDYLFISYKSDDWEVVLAEIVYKLVTEYHLNVYYDCKFDQHNDSWLKQFQENMNSEKCKGVLAFLDNRYATSYATLMELMHSQTDLAGAGEDIPIIPVNLKSFDPSKIKGTKIANEDTGLGNKNYNPVNADKEKECFNQDYNELMGNEKFRYALSGYNGKELLKLKCYLMVTRLLGCIEYQENKYHAGSDAFYKNNIVATIKSACGDSVFSEPEDSAKNAAPAQVSQPSSAPAAPVVNTAPAQPQPEEAKPAREICPARLGFEPAAPATASAPVSQAPDVPKPSAPAGEEYKLIVSGNAYCAVIKIANGMYTLLKGSRLRSDCAPTIPFAAVKIREESSRLDSNGNRIVFEDVVKYAPSYITGAIKGGSDNGAKTVKFAKSISKDEIGNYLKSAETAAVKEPAYTAASAPASQVPTVSKPSAPAGDKERVLTPEGFRSYMENVAGKAQGTCTGYASSIKKSETYAKEHGFATYRIYGDNISETNATIDALLSDMDFNEDSKRQHNQPSAAIRQFMDYMKYIGASEPTCEKKYSLTPDGFRSYMENVSGKASATCTGYVSSIKRSETYAKEHGFATYHIYGDNISETIATISALLSDSDFIEENRRQHNQPSAAIRQFMDYMKHIGAI